MGTKYVKQAAFFMSEDYWPEQLAKARKRYANGSSHPKAEPVDVPPEGLSEWDIPLRQYEWWTRYQLQTPQLANPHWGAEELQAHCRQNPKPKPEWAA